MLLQLFLLREMTLDCAFTGFMLMGGFEFSKPMPRSYYVISVGVIAPFFISTEGGLGLTVACLPGVALSGST